MGLMNTIRRNPAILIVMIGLAMAGFILMDMVTTGGPGGSQNVLGKVNGERIDMEVFQRTENRLNPNSTGDILPRREQLWNYFVDRIIVKEMADDLGLGVGVAELKELQFGTNLSPVIQRNFSNPNTRMVDREQLNSVQQAIESGQLPPELREFWAEQEREVIKERLQSKISNMINKAMYMPTWQAELVHKERSERSDIVYVRVPFDVVPDSDVTLTDADLKDYLAKNIKKFEQKEETRSLRVATISVAPTEADSQAIFKSLADLVPAFETTDNDTTFIETHLGSMDASYFTKDIFTTEEADSIFASPIGSVYGPFIEGGSYIVAKILDKMIVPDSVKARHILIQAKDPAGLTAAQTTIDSLIGVLEAKTNSFDTLAFYFGQDATRTSGGDLGFAAQGQMVKPFNDLIFFKAKPGEYHTVVTEFGVHLVEVTDRKFIENKEGIRLATLAEPILPSEETQKRQLRKANEIAMTNRTLEELEKAAGSATDWTLQSTSLFKENDYNLGLLGQGSSVREMVRWAFSQKSAGTVSQNVYTIEDDQTRVPVAYIVAALERINPAGTPKLEQVKAEVEQIVRTNKKGEKLVTLIGSNKDLLSIAERYGLTVDTAANISFATAFIPEAGNEPAVVAKVSKMSEGSTTPPIIGKNGVFVVTVMSKSSDNPPANVAMIRQQLRTQRANSVAYRFGQAMRSHAKIEDNRATFF